MKKLKSQWGKQMTKEALKLALEALKAMQMYAEAERKGLRICDEAITAIKAALAQPEQEPVAWGVFEGNLHDMFFTQSEAQEMAKLKGTHAEVRPLYTTPPQRTWVGLTDEEMMQIYIDLKSVAGFYSVEKYARDIEAKLRSKNI